MSIATKDHIFIHIPRTAGSSVEQLIGEASGHKSLSQILFDGVDDFGNKVKSRKAITIVRNPCDRLVSAYHYIKSMDRIWMEGSRSYHNEGYAELPSFKGLVLNLDYYARIFPMVYFVPQVNYVNYMGRVDPYKAFRFETIKDDWDEICSTLKIEGELPHVNPSTHKPYMEYYTDDLLEIVKRVYKDDFEVFGY